MLSPAQHPSLQNPVTALEQAASKLEQKLSRCRAEEQDLSAPSNWLTIADAEAMYIIGKKWELPEVYLKFLQQYSPLRVYIEDEKSYQGLTFYGANDLIEGQYGYSFNPVTGMVIEGWPENMIVIATDGADPYCIDITNEEAPVYSAIHDEWPREFELCADSFIEFLDWAAE